MEGTLSAARRARRLRLSRDRWKRRSQGNTQLLKRLRGKLADVMASRDQWKQRAQQYRQQAAAADEGEPALGEA